MSSSLWSVALRDGDAADLDRLERGPRIERPRSADADVDLVEPRLRSHRRPLEGAAQRGRRAARRAALLVDRVDLDHDPVDLVVELDALRLPRRGRPRRPPRPTRAARRTDSCGSRARGATRASPSASRARRRRARRGRTPRSTSGRDAVIDESFWRSEPAAAFRGFGASFWPARRCRSFSSRKPESGMYTSPRTSAPAAALAAAHPERNRRDRPQVDRHVLALYPSPRVAPRVKPPSS